MNDPEISVIVPVYNVEKYLPKCINSILGQSFFDFELILIDDGSRDNSGAICDEYAKKDKRIKVLHTENRGVSSARNCGIENACGRYITFVDSDDYVDADYLSNFSVSTVKADLYIQGCRVVNTIANTVSFRKFDKTDYYKDIKYPYLAAEKNSVIKSPYVKLFNRAILLNCKVRFDTTLTNGEDLIFVLNYMLYVRTVFISNLAAYNYIISDRESLSKKNLSFDTRIRFSFRAYKLRKQVMKKHNISDSLYFEYINYLLINSYLLAIMRLYRSNSLTVKNDRVQHIENYREYISKNLNMQRVKQKTLYMKIFNAFVNSNLLFKDFFIYFIVQLQTSLTRKKDFIRGKLFQPKF
ncbi:MAG: glycosyltransferase family 2 protein [Candidatus Electrothrix sp. AR5]|nr:glycosyltransferase family 2 protein [Candidatus Electrothrix sp. AR5]